MKTLLITISLFIAISSCAKKEESDESGSSNQTNTSFGKFISVGQTGTILTSSDGISWDNVSSGSTENLRAVAYGNKTLAIAGYSGTILTSNDAVTWTTRTSGTSENFYEVTYGNGLYVAVGAAGTILTSSGGYSWTSRSSGTTNGLTGVTYKE